ncbi:MAG TPA: hypothetical protein VIF62_04050 [Labilithrix sp.]|jgi:hypothetical protein
MTKLSAVSGLSVIFGLAVLAACSAAPAQDDSGDDSSSVTKDGGTFVRDGSTYDSTPSSDSGLGELRFQPSQSFSGYDGAHAFTVPVAVYDYGSDLKLTADDPSAVAIKPAKLVNPVNQDGVADNGKYFLVSVLKAGAITLTATSAGRHASTTITVVDYSPDRWAAGQARYVNGGGGDPPCTNCHVNGQAIDHSPAALATSDDQKVAAVITTGISPAGFPIQGVQGGHRWSATPAELDGLVTYLRALDPRGFE